MTLQKFGHISLLLILLSSSCVSAYPPITQKFRYWFSNWGDSHEIGISNATQCGPAFDRYWNPLPNDTYQWKCTLALDCVLNLTADSSSQMLSTSLVVLGLTPGMLSTLGSTVAESTMLSYRNQPLALLLSISSPAFCPTSLSEYDNPLKILQSPYHKAWKNNRQVGGFIRSQSRHRSLWVLGIEYLLLLAAIFNTVHVSLDLGVRSVSTWQCENWWMPLVWVLIPSGIHLLGVISFLFTPKKIERSSSGGVDKDVINASPPTVWTLIVNLLAVFSVTVHIVFGTLVFSSLLFLTVMDASRVVVQFAASAIVCKFIGQYELMLMSEKYSVKYVSQNGEQLDESRMLMESITVYAPQKERDERHPHVSTA